MPTHLTITAPEGWTPGAVMPLAEQLMVECREPLPSDGPDYHMDHAAWNWLGGRTPFTSGQVIIRYRCPECGGDGLRTAEWYFDECKRCTGSGWLQVTAHAEQEAQTWHPNGGGNVALGPEHHRFVLLLSDISNPVTPL